MAKFTIVETRKVRSLNQANESGFDTLVTYTDDADRLHTVIVAGNNPSAQDIDAAVSGVHSDRTQHRGRTIET